MALLNLWGALQSFSSHETANERNILHTAIKAVNTQMDQIEEEQCDKTRDKNRLSLLVQEVINCLSWTEIIDTLEEVKKQRPK